MSVASVDIAICYPHKGDTKNSYVKPFIESLKAAGISYWIDGKINDGEAWDLEIKKHFQNARYVVAFLTNEAMNSKYIKETELQIALNNNKLKAIQASPTIFEAFKEITELQFVRLSAEPESEEREFECLEDIPTNSKLKKVLNNFVKRLNDDLHTGGQISKSYTPRIGKMTHLTDVDISEQGLQRRIEYIDEMFATKKSENLLNEHLIFFLEAYVTVYKMGHHSIAIDYYKKFLSLLRKRHVVPYESHEKILALCEVGLPESDKNHIYLDEINAEQLVAMPGYATILRAVKKMSVDWSQALEILDGITSSGDIALSRCPLACYSKAQCIRKVMKDEGLTQAEAVAEQALDLLPQSSDDKDLNRPCNNCNGALSCHVRSLKIQALRGKAVILRRIGELEESEEYFDKAFEQCDVDDIKVMDSLRSDVHYGYAYMLFSKCLKKYNCNLEVSNDWEDDMKKAKEHFEKAGIFNRQWGAPVLRQAISHYLLQKGATKNRLSVIFQKAQNLCHDESNSGSAESDLSEVLAGYGILYCGGQVEEKAALDVLEKLIDHFEKRDPGTGPRECHAFDIRALSGNKEPENEILALIYCLMQEAGTWSASQADSSEKRKRLVQSYRERVEDIKLLVAEPT